MRRAARSPIVFDDFIGLAFQRGIGATRPAGGVCRSVGKTCDGHAVVARLWPRTAVRDWLTGCVGRGERGLGDLVDQ